MLICCALNTLAINVTDTSNDLDLDAARQVAHYFRLSTSRAESIIDEVLSATQHWEKTAARYNIPAHEISTLGKAFRVTA